MPAPEALPDALYHGTTELYLEAMLRDGLAPCNMTGAVHMLCLTDDIEVAMHHGQFMSSWEHAPMVIFKIPMDRFDQSLFVLEDNFVRLGPSAGRGVEAYKAMTSREWKTTPWTWRSMLQIGGAVGYTGTVKVSSADLMDLAELTPASISPR